MVLGDLDFNSRSNSGDEKVAHHQIAPVADRVLAFVFDLVIFTPVFSFILASVFRHLQLMYYVSPQSIEFAVLLAVSVLFIAVLTILFQTLFLFANGSTPGKSFFKIQVVSFEQNPTLKNHRLKFTQAFLRSTLWVMETAFLFLPWLEVMSEGFRRPLHDRAAGTIVVTTKKVGDSGPHPIESLFVRQFLVLCSFLVFLWGIVTVGHFYQGALAGEYKRSELQQEDFLCASVTQAIDSGDLRIDKAISMFLADEISEECLTAEADFVLWTPSENEKSWAYLAKGLTKKYDSQMFESYLQKACDLDSEGPACQIAEYQASPKSKEISQTNAFNTKTGNVLAVIRNFENGRYDLAEQGFVGLSAEKGMENFSQQGLVKSLWAENKKELSRGAYLTSIHHLDQNSKRDLAAWVCHEELDRSCGVQAVEACEDLKKEMSADKAPIQNSFLALALIRDQECRQSAEVDYLQFHQLFQDKKDLYSFVRAISRDSKLSRVERNEILQNLAFRKESVKPVFLRLAAIREWTKWSNNDADLSVIVTFLKEKKVRDLSWAKIYELTLNRLISLKSQKLLKEIASLPSADMVTRYQWQTNQMKAFYLSQDFSKAYAVLKQLEGKSRNPASTDSSENDEIEIRKDLKKRFQGAGEL